MRIYGHYSLINGKDSFFYRHPVRTFDISDQDGKEKWTAYKFTRNLYDKFYPIHHERFCSAVDQLPNPEDFIVESFSNQPNLASVE